jgi:hypothetical protein
MDVVYTRYQGPGPSGKEVTNEALIKASHYGVFLQWLANHQKVGEYLEWRWITKEEAAQHAARGVKYLREF